MGEKYSWEVDSIALPRQAWCCDLPLLGIDHWYDDE